MFKADGIYKNWPRCPESLVNNGRVTRLQARQDVKSVTPDWVQDALAETVRLGSGHERLEARNLSLNHRRIELEGNPKDLFSQDVVKPDSKFYFDVLREKFPSLPDGFTEEFQVISLLLNPLFRAGKLGGVSLNFVDRLIMAVNESYLNYRPIELIVPSLPFKDQNPITTGHSLGFVDLGEYVTLFRWGLLCRSISSIHSPGIRMHILSDGNIYADIFANGKVPEIDLYRFRCQAAIKELGLSSFVDIVDMERIVNLEPRFEDVRLEIGHLLEREENREFLAQLSLGMIFNMPPNREAGSIESLTRISGLTAHEIEQSYPSLSAESNVAAKKYASFLLTMRNLEILPRAYPEKTQIRATVHPKQNQLGLLMVSGSIGPYNGVPVVDISKIAQGKNILNSTASRRLVDVLENQDSAAIYLPNQDEPFFYAHI